MDGCQWDSKKFSNPASHNTSQVQWDYAFLTKQQFIAKWGEVVCGIHMEITCREKQY
jgi:hypothetical protein